MRLLEYIYKEGDIIHVIRIDAQGNKKLGHGRTLKTYHFSVDQLSDPENDSKNCLGCPLSFQNGNRKCYTHKGLQWMGIRSMLKRLGKMKLYNFNAYKFKAFIQAADYFEVELVRFGVYGEPVLMNIEVFKELRMIAPSVGYTHQWKKYPEFSGLLQASTHNEIEVIQANNEGWTVYNIGNIEGLVNCPASKESTKKSSCLKCKMCSGEKFNLFINQH